jgi:hypothetical protein
VARLEFDHEAAERWDGCGYDAEVHHHSALVNLRFSPLIWSGYLLGPYSGVDVCPYRSLIQCPLYN